MNFWKIDDYINDHFDKIISGDLMNSLKEIVKVNTALQQKCQAHQNKFKKTNIIEAENKT